MTLSNGTNRRVREPRVGRLAFVALALLSPGIDAATFRGKITQCSGTTGAPGHVVKAFEELKLGFRDGVKPCTVVAQPAQLVGTATARADGGYTISYTPTERDPENCLFDRKVFVKVFLPDGTTLIHTSARRNASATMIFDFDTGVVADCPQISIPTSLELDPPTIISGGPATHARVSLQSTTGGRSVATTVNLFASDGNDLVMDPTVVVPPGQTAAEFAISASPPGGKVVTIFAEANGTTVTADLAIQPNGPRKGFINNDEKRDISDPVFLLNFLFSGGAPPAFPAFADVNGSGKIDISDAVAMLTFLFTSGEVPTLCTSDPEALPSRLHLNENLVTDGERVVISGNFPSPVYRVALKGFAFPNGRLLNGNQVVGERVLVYCACRPAVRAASSGPDGEPAFVLPFDVPLDAPSGEYEVYVLPDGASCPAGNLVQTGCLEDNCAIGPMRLFVQPSHIVSLWEGLDITDDSEPAGDSPSELFFTFASQTGEPDATDRFPVQFADSYPGGRPGSQHLTSGVNPVSYSPQVPVFVGREADMERTECEEECLSDPDPARCRTACAEAARRMNNNIAVTLGGAEFDCLQGCSSIWDEVAGVGTAVLGCLVGVKTGNPKAGCAAGITLGAIFERKLEDVLEDEDDDLGSVEFNFNRGASPFWAVGSTAPPAGLSRTDIGIGLVNHRLPAFRVIDSKLSLKSVTLVEADDAPCFAPDELFFETRASLGLNGRLGDSTRFPGTEGLPVAEGATQDLSSFSLSAGGGADSSILYVEIGVWDYDGDDENELIGLHSRTFFLGDVLETSGVSGTDFVAEGRERRRVRVGGSARVTGWNSGERCDCAGISACATNLRLPHGIADISYEIEVTWEKYPQ